MIVFTAIIACMIGLSFSSPIANNYIENVLGYTLKNQIQMNKLDPAAVPNFNTIFYDKLPIIGKVKGEANFTDGKITGLSTAVRYSECSGPFHSFGVTTVNCSIGFYILHSQYSGKMKYGKLPGIHINGNANISTTTMFVNIVSQPGSNVGRVSNMQFQMIGEVQPKFTGLGKLNKYMKFLEDGYKTQVKAELLNLIANHFNYALNVAVGQLPMPQ